MRFNKTKVNAEDLVRDFMEYIEETDLGKRAKEEKVFNFSNMKEITYSPFRAFREDLDSGRLAVHRRTFLGTFYCTVKKAKWFLRNLERTYEKGNVTEKRYNEVKTMLTEYIKRKENV